MASTAMIQHEIDVPLFELSRTIGKSSAERVWHRSAQAMESLRNVRPSPGIDCQLEARNTLYLSQEKPTARVLNKEAKARTVAGLNARSLSAGELRPKFDIERTVAIVSPTSASANPAQLTAGLLRDTLTRGCEIVAGVEVTDLHPSSDEVVLATSTCHLLVAAHVVFRTG